MLDYLEQLFEHISPVVAYIILGCSAFLENVVPPIPGDMVVVLGAYLVSMEKLDFWGVYIATTIGSLAGFMTMYLAGKYFGRPFIYKKSRARFFKEAHIKRVEIWFSKWGYWVIFANRFLSGTRSVISLFAGFFHLKIYYVFVLGLISAAVWHAILIIAGILVGKNWHVISTVVLRYNQFFLLLIIILITFFVIRRIKRRKTLAAKTHEE
jgi:membrane protein DedA with SNARE-associated domain